MRNVLAALAIGTAAVTLTTATPAAATSSAATSTFVAYSESSFGGDSRSISGCGLHTIPYRGSYKWYSNGQSGHMFNNSTGSGVPHTRLSSDDDAESRSGFGWRSILIVC
ncbi:hypothetical protein GCM10022224_024840 [Nonomuraea antimicrobica]|uniref:MiAMP1 protein n=1 Tax=Nonomuraea antimicrobica TaxID=561173 RepID=A0ABP7BIM2_9ACTN